MLTDEDMPEDLYCYLQRFSKEQLIEIMSEALDYMQQYNGRTIKFCILSAMGWEEHEKDDDRRIWKAGPNAIKPEKVEPEPQPTPVPAPEAEHAKHPHKDYRSFAEYLQGEEEDRVLKHHGYDDPDQLQAATLESIESLSPIEMMEYISQYFDDFAKRFIF